MIGKQSPRKASRFGFRSELYQDGLESYPDRRYLRKSTVARFLLQ